MHLVILATFCLAFFLSYLCGLCCYIPRHAKLNAFRPTRKSLISQKPVPQDYDFQKDPLYGVSKIGSVYYNPTKQNSTDGIRYIR